MRAVDEELRLGGRREDDVELLPAAADRIGAPVVPAAEHREEVLRERRSGRSRRSRRWPGCTDHRAARARAAPCSACSSAGWRRRSSRTSPPCRAGQLLGHPRRNRRKKRSASALLSSPTSWKSSSATLLAGVHAGLHRAHQQRALAHLPRSLDRERLARLAYVIERHGVGLPRQIPRIVHVERAAWAPGNGLAA